MGFAFSDFFSVVACCIEYVAYVYYSVVVQVAVWVPLRISWCRVVTFCELEQVKYVHFVVSGHVAIDCFYYVSSY